MSKRILSLVLALVMVLGTFGTLAFADSGNERVEWLREQGIVQGDEKGNLNLDSTIDRASVAKLVVEALDLGAVAEGMKNYKTSFSDVPATHWANGYINVVSARGIMIGDAGKFMPSNQISYAEVLTILVRVMDGLTADEEKTAVWPTTYIAKAHELGILEDVNVASYQEAAVRERIFEMFYNAMTEMEIGNYHIVKGIVLENYRVENLDEEEIVIEVIQEVQKADFATENRKGDQLNLIIPAKVGDVEDLLGKVADFSINKAGDVVKVTVDETYKYEVGALSAIEDALTIDGKEYTVIKDERYEERDDRVFRTYENNRSYAYSRYATASRYTSDDVKEADFARVTVKNGKVLFVDAFVFDDIAPVQEVRNDGKAVYVYDDARNGAVKKVDFNAKTKVIAVDGKETIAANLEDIQPMDVIHTTTTGNTVLVRLDAAVEGEFERVRYNKNDDLELFVDGESYVALNKDADGRRAVYTTDLDEFNTLELSSQLNPYKEKDVVLLLDMNDNVQYVSSEVLPTDFLALVKKIVGTEVQLVTEKDKTENYRVNLDSSLFASEDGSQERRLNAFDIGGLVKVSVDEDGYIKSMVQVAENEPEVEEWDIDPTTATAISRAQKSIGETLVTGELSITNSRLVEVDGVDAYVNTRTLVFINTATTKRVATIKELMNDKVFDQDEFVAYMIHSDDVANVIVITDLEELDSAKDSLVLKFDKLAGSGSTRWILAYDAEGELHEIKWTGTRSLNDLERHDIIEVTVEKDDHGVATDFERLIEYDTNTVYEIKDIDQRGLRITLNDNSVYWLDEDVVLFGTSSLLTKDRVQIVLDEDTGRFITIASRVTKAVTEDGDDSVETDGTVTYINDTRIFVDDARYTMDEDTVLLAADEETILAVGGVDINKLVNKYDIVDVVEVKNGVVVEMVLVETQDDRDEDAQKAAAVDSLIAGISQSSIDNYTVDEAKFNAAKTAYDALTAKQKALVKAANVTKLEAAEAAIAQAKVNAMVNSFWARKTIHGGKEQWSVSLRFSEIAIKDLDSLVIALYAGETKIGEQEATQANLDLDRGAAAGSATIPFYTDNTEDAYWTKNMDLLSGTPDKLVLTFELDGETYTIESTDVR